MSILLVVLWIASCFAQSVVMEDVGRSNLPAQRIGVDDLLAISVYRSPELTRTVRVDADGSIALPLLQRPIPAAGLLPNQLEVAIAQALKSGGILVNPVVKVTVAEYASRPISVVGAVKKPLTFQAVGRVTLLDALARAEGLSPEAAEEILVSRPDQPVQRIPVKRLIDGADPELNVRLSGGEEIRVPEAGRIFVLGNVRKPGAFLIRDLDEASVLKLLAMAEGLAPYAGKRAYIYRQQQEITVELDQMMQRKSPDIPLVSNDILYITDNKGRRATINVIDRVTSFGASTASGVLIWRR